MAIGMKRNPIDWSSGTVVDTSALDLTNKQKYDIGIDNEKLQSKIIRKDCWTLTYEEFKEKKEKQLVLGTFI